MADYWKSQPKKFCIYCKCWIADNKPSIEFHERGKNHKENVVKKINDIKQKSVAKHKADEKMSKEFAAMEEAALKAYEEDLKRLADNKPAPIAPVGPTAEERRARDEQKRKEIEALEKHHAKKQWTKTFSPEGYPYYYNTLTGETQWEEPDGFQENKPKSEEQGAKSVWVEGVSEEGYTYYYNAETGESRWEKPEGFDCAPTSNKDPESSPDKSDKTAEEEADSGEDKAKATSEDSTSEETTSAPSVTKTPKIQFRRKKEEKTDETSESDSKEEEDDNEIKEEAEAKETDEKTEEKDSPPKLPIQRPRKANPYGAWETIQQEEDPYENVDLELPNIEYDDPQLSIPDLPKEPKVKFKEKTITSLGDTVVGISVFKKRKLENVKPRNIRQRLKDQ